MTTMEQPGISLDVLAEARARYEAWRRLHAQALTSVVQERHAYAVSLLRGEFIGTFGAGLLDLLNARFVRPALGSPPLIQARIVDRNVSIALRGGNAWWLVTLDGTTRAERVYPAEYTTEQERADALLARIHMLVSGELDGLPF
jgi:hypothetical protein